MGRSLPRAALTIVLVAACLPLTACESFLDSLAERGFRQLQCEIEALEIACTANFQELGATILAEANSATATFEHATELIAPDRPLSSRVQTALATILEGEPEVREIGGHCSCNNYKPFPYFNKSSIRIVVLPQDSPLAQAYPNGTVYVTAGLIDSTLQHGAKNDAQLHGVLAHELVHLREGHVFVQWAFLRGRNRQNTKLALSTFSRILSIAIPVPTYTYESTIRFGDATRVEKAFEYEADLGAIKILERLGHDPAEYLRFLEMLSRYREKYRPLDKAPYGWIDGRITCLRRMLSPTDRGGSARDQLGHATMSSQHEDDFMACAAEQTRNSDHEN